MIFTPRHEKSRQEKVLKIEAFRRGIMTAKEVSLSAERNRPIAGLIACALCSAMLIEAGAASFVMAAQASDKDAKSNKTKKSEPAGTLLMPLTPKLDLHHEETPTPASAAASSSASGSPSLHIDSRLEYDTEAVELENEKSESELKQEEPQEALLKPAPETVSPEHGKIDASALTINEDTTLKGTIQIVADDTEYDQEKNTFLGTGNAVAIIAGQNAKLEADMILYDQASDMIDARGNVRILRDGQLTTGSSFKFKVTSDEYLITEPDTEVQGAQVIARTGYGTKDGLAFKSANVTMDRPLYFGKNQMNGPISYLDEMFQKKQHPDAYVPVKPSFKFKARKMVYERHKETGNVTVFGGRLMFGKLGVPLPKFVTTVGKEDVVSFPITPYLGNNMLVGGLNLGPNFHHQIGKFGQLNWAPLVQLGGRRLDGTATETGTGIGMGAQVGFTGQRLQAHLAYGTNTNLLVGDIKYQATRNLKLHSGINRFLDDGMFGFRRARLIAEAVDNRRLNGIPFITGINFRTSFGWAQDNPQLINLTPEYSDLFDKTSSTKLVSGYRLQEHITASTHPIFKLGNDKYGLSTNLFGGLALRGYSSGDSMVMAQVGPNLEVALNRLKGRVGYTQSAVRGQSPFIFDQFIQGQRSCYMAGDIKINKYLTVGGSVGYNLIDKLAYSKTLTAAIGPEDFKVLLSRDFLRGVNRFGFDVIYGGTSQVNKLVLKGRPDYGQLGGI